MNANRRKVQAKKAGFRVYNKSQQRREMDC